MASIPLLVLLARVSNTAWISSVALGIVVLQVILAWKRLGGVARLLYIGAIGLTALFLAAGQDYAVLLDIAQTSVYLPALLIAIQPLSIAIQRSRFIVAAGTFMVDQPPNRRYVYLAMGAQVFGVLLNIGGLLLLLQTALTRLAGAPVQSSTAWIRRRRVINAIQRGFAAHIIWSPLGLGLNLLLSIVPTLTWVDFAPYALTTALALIVIGHLIDRIENRNATPAPSNRSPRAIGGLMILTLVLIAIAVLTFLLDGLTGMGFQTALLLIVPSAAMAIAAIPVDSKTVPRIGSTLEAAGNELPRLTNEIAIVSGAAFFGLLIAHLMPEAVIADVVAAFELSGTALGLTIAATIFLLASVGLNPMVAATILVSTCVAANLAIPAPQLVLSAMIGWSLALIISPATSTVAIAAGYTGLPAKTIGWRWNAAFCVAVFILMAGAFYLIW